ncbi:hypothetical protein NYZ94_00250 (plasmid) [Ligilactobacillus salivarius]|nr:hypothetical protein NYZ94_01475 [Ligilactobacillus salivarius]UXI83682.1 hypothetical protein NYZ94_00250 [Ligilactobacillus salivarius]
MNKLEQIGWEVAEVISRKIRELAAEGEVDTKEGEFMVIQPLTDNQAIWYEMTFTDKGKRKINIKVNDSVYILPKIDKNFEMFADESEEEDNE